MKWISLAGLGILGGIGGYIYATSPASNSKLYEGTPESLFSRTSTLAATPDGVEIDGKARLPGGVEVKLDRDSPKSITWHFSIKGKEYGQYAAVFAPEEGEPGKTRVTFNYDIDMSKVRGERFGSFAVDFTNQVGMPILEDYVQSALEQRPFNGGAAQGRMMAFVIANPLNGAMYGQVMTEEIENMGDEMKSASSSSNSRSSYSSERPGAPSTDLSRYNK